MPFSDKALAGPQYFLGGSAYSRTEKINGRDRFQRVRPMGQPEAALPIKIFGSKLPDRPEAVPRVLSML